MVVVIVYLRYVNVLSFVLNTCVNLLHQAAVSCVIFRPSRVPSDDQMPVAVTSCVDGNFKLWSLSADGEVSGLSSVLMVIHVCLTGALILKSYVFFQFVLNINLSRLCWFFGHTARADNLCTAVLHGWISGKKRRGRPRRRWTDDIRDWMGSSVAECTRMAQERELWRTMVSLSQVIDLQQ